MCLFISSLQEYYKLFHVFRAIINCIVALIELLYILCIQFTVCVTVCVCICGDCQVQIFYEVL